MNLFVRRPSYIQCLAVIKIKSSEYILASDKDIRNTIER